MYNTVIISKMNTLLLIDVNHNFVWCVLYLKSTRSGQKSLRPFRILQESRARPHCNSISNQMRPFLRMYQHSVTYLTIQLAVRLLHKRMIAKHKSIKPPNQMCIRDSYNI